MKKSILFLIGIFSFNSHSLSINSEDTPVFTTNDEIAKIDLIDRTLIEVMVSKKMYPESEAKITIKDMEVSDKIKLIEILKNENLSSAKAPIEWSGY